MSTDNDAYPELEGIKRLTAELDKESASMMLATYRGAIDVVRKGVIGGSNDPERFLQIVSGLLDAIEPMESAYWNVH